MTPQGMLRAGKQPKPRWTACWLALALSLFPILAGAAETGSSTPPARNPARSTFVSNVTFVVFDTETTGFSSTSDRMVELGVVKFRNGKMLEETKVVYLSAGAKDGVAFGFYRPPVEVAQLW